MVAPIQLYFFFLFACTLVACSYPAREFDTSLQLPPAQYLVGDKMNSFTALTKGMKLKHGLLYLSNATIYFLALPCVPVFRVTSCKVNCLVLQK